MPKSSIWRSTLSRILKLLLASPWGTVMMRASLHWSATLWAYWAGTPLSVTTATRRSSRANWYRFSSEPLLTMMS